MLFSFRTNEHNQMQPKKHNTKVHYPCTARLIKKQECNFALLAPSDQVSLPNSLEPLLDSLNTQCVCKLFFLIFLNKYIKQTCPELTPGLKSQWKSS